VKVLHKFSPNRPIIAAVGLTWTRFDADNLQIGSRHINPDQDDIPGNLAIVFDMSDIESFIIKLQ
jgi:hypothetical protein